MWKKNYNLVIPYRMWALAPEPFVNIVWSEVGSNPAPPPPTFFRVWRGG
jgi:hypothetical protein